ncbi:hypothetical protein ACWEN3_42335, partial [Streptomyces sp. NPDC004561]
AALRRAGIPAPRGIRTGDLAEALAWAETSRLPGYLLAPAAAGLPVEPVVCDGEPQISAAWARMGRAAERHCGDAHLVLTELLSPGRFVVNSVSRPGADGRTDHSITDVWAETRAADRSPDRTDLMGRHQPLTVDLSMYMLRVLDALGVLRGPVTARLAYEQGRGSLLVSALAVPGLSPAEEALHGATGSDRALDPMDIWEPPSPVRRLPVPAGHRIVRVHLHSGAGGAVDPALGRVLRRLPTVVSVGEDRRAPGTARCAEAVLSSTDPEAVEADYRVIRALEREGGYGVSSLRAGPRETRTP